MKSEEDFFQHIDAGVSPILKSHIHKKRVKTVCTVGPSCQKISQLQKMVRYGMNVARLNFSHGARDQYRQWIRNIRKTEKLENKYLAILQDIQGPKIRIGKFENNAIFLKKSQKFVVTTKSVTGNHSKVSCNYRKLHKEIKKDHRILLDDGLILLVVEKVIGQDIHTRVVFGGTLKDQKGMNLPDTPLQLSCITNKDEEDLKFGLEQGVDLIALSFIKNANDILKVRKLLKGYREPPPLIAKIETAQAVQHLDEILQVSDGIMVARGDLGVECPLEQVPGLQKKMIRAANRAGKFVITATQMLESMTGSPRPTRAEASDVANAVLDGTDAVMLSAETATGDYPVDSVRTMGRIIVRAEEYSASLSDIQEHRMQETKKKTNEAVIAAAVQTTNSLEAAAIVGFTESGMTARNISRLRPSPPIFALTTRLNICRQLSVVWGVTPSLTRRMKHTDDMTKLSKQVLKKFSLWKPKAKIIMLSGTPLHRPGSTNLLRIHEVS